MSDYITAHVARERAMLADPHLGPPDPACPRCHGTGRLECRVMGYTQADDRNVTEICGCRREEE